jgi:mitochondrial fission protein ELM1/Uma2 family endonuclease
MTTGETGMVNQANGLAEVLGWPFEMKTVHPTAPWRGLPGHWAASVGALGGVPEMDGVRPPWPDLLITCGRRSVFLAIAIKRASGGRTFTVHIQNPQVPPRYFDLIAAPEHDLLSAPNAVATKGALHRLSREVLAEAGERLRERFAGLKRPFAAALIGGNSKSHVLTPQRARELAGQLRRLTDSCGVGLAVTVSRRTGAENTAILREALAGSGALFWDGEGENPYLAMLALADWIIVTEDSASMTSEACFTGKPVYVAAVEGHAKRIKRMHRQFREAGFTRPFEGRLDAWRYEPLDETRRVAGVVRERLAEHQRRQAARRSDRWEIIGGERVARQSETGLHWDVKLAIAAALQQAIESAGLDCSAQADGPALRIGDRFLLEPDAAIYRGASGNGAEPEMIAAIEALSPSTALTDLRDKLEAYSQAPGLRHYVICDPDKRLVIHHVLGEDGRIETRLLRRGALRLDPPGLTVDAASFFA